MKKPETRGRRTLYDDAAVARAVTAAKTAATDEQIIQAIGCSIPTYYRWLSKKPDFAAAIAAAKKTGPDDDELPAALLEMRTDAIAWMKDYFRTRGEVIENCEGDGQGSYKKTRSGGAPDMRLLERILGQEEAAGLEKFEVVVKVVEPEIIDCDAEV